MKYRNYLLVILLDLTLLTLLWFFPRTLTLSARPVEARALHWQATNIIINEVDADTPGADSAEFIELYDNGAGNTALDGLTLVLYNGSNDQSYYALDLDGYRTDANGYFVIGNPGVNLVATTFPTDTLQQGADAVALYLGNASAFPNGTAVVTTNLLDAMVYDTADPDDTGLLPLINAGQPQVNESGGGASADHANARCPNGSGGSRNTVGYAQIPPSAGAANNCNAVAPTATPRPTNTPVVPTPTSSVTPATGIIINEVDSDSPSTDTAEFVELYDGGVGNTALEGLAVVFFDGADDESYLAIDLDGFKTDASGYFVLGNEAVASASITFSNSALQNGADAIALYIGSASDFPTNTPLRTTNLMDALVYHSDDADDTGLLTLLQPGQLQMNENGARNADAVAMARCPNGSGGARMSNTLALVSPSPKEPNNCGSPLPTLTPSPTSLTPSPTRTPTTVATVTPGGTPVVSSVLINEVEADSPGTDAADFVELFGAPNATLDNLCLLLFNGSNDRAYLVVDLKGKTLNSGGFFVVGNPGVANVGITTATNIQNGPDAVALATAADCGASFSTNTVVTGTAVLDAVVYGTNDDNDPELLQLLQSGQPQLNEDEGGDSELHSNARCPDGGGGARNTSSFDQMPPSPGVTNGCGSAVPTATPTATPAITITPDDREGTVTPTPVGTPGSIYLPLVQR